MATTMAQPKRQTADEALAWLRRRGTKKQLAEHERYGIVAPQALGVSVGELKKYAKVLGVHHDRAIELFDSGWYEARLLAAFTADASRLTVREMNRWTDTFDNWAVVDTVCFHLFDRSPLAWARVPVWAKAKPEFKKRAAFALIWGLSVHDKTAGDEPFLEVLPLIESAARDERHYVKKAVDMALRAVGKRNMRLNAACIDTASKLAASEDKTSSWIGKQSLRELESSSVGQRLLRQVEKVTRRKK
jgi:3-methyladenine DNA glycosylase AlkD